MADHFIDITGDNFAEKVTGATQTVAVLFSTPQSNACQIQEPEIAAISKDYEGRVTFARINVEVQQQLTDQYHIEGVPTLIFFKGGQELYRIKGIMMRNKLRRQLEGVLLAN